MTKFNQSELERKYTDHNKVASDDETTFLFSCLYCMFNIFIDPKDLGALILSKEGVARNKWKDLDLRMPDLSKILPADHFINVYTRWVKGLTDAYYEYNVCSALWLLAAWYDGKIVLKTKQGTIKANIFVQILGKSTTSRKSTAVKKCREIYERVTGTKLTDDAQSVEGLIESLALNSHQNLISDESSGLMAKYHKKYNEGIFDELCKYYDGVGTKKILSGSKTGGPTEFTVTDPYINSYYATTTRRYCNVMNIMDFECGYGYRTLYAVPTYQKPYMDIDMETDEDVNNQAVVIKHGNAIYQILNNLGTTEMAFNDDALALYQSTTRKWETEADKFENDIYSSALGRASDYVLKIAMLIEIGKTPISDTITKKSIEVAINLVGTYFLPSCIYVIERLEEDEKFNQIEKVLKKLRDKGGSCGHSYLLRAVKIKSNDFSEVIETLIESETIKKYVSEETGAQSYLLINDDDSVLSKLRADQDSTESIRYIPKGALTEPQLKGFDKILALMD
ncbi:hypothetical protein LI82_02650 [Methanococcoides methylutens]|uniref:Uncharacterized protein n=1 Tax=Methanococcoides methylutens TaxID=2226 RepID=A0A099T1B2_METMT|nr:DUF3987 domain-containing protein [Methanococcoides methylutens]KGK98960.1 hypothetical protein LI82_02650 [Methanococcoides methylutens]